MKYASKQKNDWKKLVEVYEACTEFNRFKRPQIKRVLDLLNANSTSQPIYFRIVLEAHVVVDQPRI